MNLYNDLLIILMIIRGIFVTEPPDGNTYNCAKFPSDWAAEDANGIKKIEDPTVAVETLGLYIYII